LIFSDPYSPPLKVALDNIWSGFKAKYQKKPISLDPNQLMQFAQQTVGSTDWGENRFKIAYEKLLTSFEEEANLSHFGRERIQNVTMRGMMTQLRIQAFLKGNPGVTEKPITRPIVIASFPRTGTTLLHKLMATDPKARVPLFWELVAPIPPCPPEMRDKDPRIELVRAGLNKGFERIPKMRAIHNTESDAPEECLVLFRNILVDPYFSLLGHIPSYLEWYLQYDLKEAYRFYYKQLQILQCSLSGSPWVLKAPLHMFGLEALLEVFPEACIVQIHRDPGSFLPSFCSMAAVEQRVSTKKTDMKQIGRTQLALAQEALSRGKKARAKAPDRFLDLSYKELITDPAKAVSRIYDHFQFPMDAQMPDRLRAWMGENRQHKLGKHQYSIKDFGLDEATLKHSFSEYLEEIAEMEHP